MQYCAKVQHLHAQVAPDLPIDAFVAAVNPQALGFHSRNQLYAPIEFSVQVAGPLKGAAGAIRVNVPVHANPDWLPVMKHRFAAMIGQPMLSLDQLDFRTVDGRSISEVPMDKLHCVGKLHVYVNDKELRLPQVPAIPIEYSVTKMHDIDNWITTTVEEKMPALVARYLAPCKNVDELNAAIRAEGPLVKAMEAAVQGSNRAEWAEFVRTRNVNSPIVMDAAEATKAAQVVAHDILLGEVRRLIKAAAPQLEKHFSQLRSAELAKEAAGRANADHYAPILGLAPGAESGEDAIENVSEFYHDLIQDMMTAPHVRDAITSAIYLRPMLSIGCKWKPGQYPHSPAAAAPAAAPGGAAPPTRQVAKKTGLPSGGAPPPTLKKGGGAPPPVTPSPLSAFEQPLVLAGNERAVAEALNAIFTNAFPQPQDEAGMIAAFLQGLPNLVDGTHVADLENIASQFRPQLIALFPVDGAAKGSGRLAAAKAAVVGAARYVYSWFANVDNKTKTTNLVRAIVKRYRGLQVLLQDKERLAITLKSPKYAGNANLYRNAVKAAFDRLGYTSFNLFATDFTDVEFEGFLMNATGTTQLSLTGTPEERKAIVIAELNRLIFGTQVESSESGQQEQEAPPEEEEQESVTSSDEDEPGLSSGGGPFTSPRPNAPSTPSPSEQSAEPFLSPRPPRKETSAQVGGDTLYQSVIQNQYGAQKTLDTFLPIFIQRWNAVKDDKQKRINEVLTFYLASQAFQEAAKSDKSYAQSTFLSDWWMRTLTANQSNPQATWPFVKALQEIRTQSMSDFGGTKREDLQNKIAARTANPGINIEGSIEAHHPWNAMIHHTIQPMMGGAYPAYYNAMHTKQDMTAQAPYIGDLNDTYRAYHLFAGVPVAPLNGLQRIGHNARTEFCKENARRFARQQAAQERANQRDIDADPTRDSDAFRLQVRGEGLRPASMGDEVPPLVPRTGTSKAPPVRPIGSSIATATAAAPPVRPIGNKVPSYLPVDCHLSDSDSDDEGGMRAQMLLGSMFDSSDEELGPMGDELSLPPLVSRKAAPGPCPPTIAAPMTAHFDEFGFPTLQKALAKK
jgi:hypothetical protein